MGQNNILFLRHYTKEALDGFHLSSADTTHQELSNTPSHVPFGPVAEKLRAFLAVIFFGQIIIYFNAKCKLPVQYWPFNRCFSPLPNGARRAARLKLALLHLHARHWDEAYHGLNDWLHSQGSSGEGGIPEGESKESQAVEGEGAPEADRVVEEAERDRALVLLEKIRLVSEAH